MNYIPFSRQSVAFVILTAGLFCTLTACSESSSKEQAANTDKQSEIAESEDATASTPKKDLKSKANDFIPEGYVLFEKVEGDLNKDGVQDCVLLIKGTNKEMIVEDEDQGELDRNRRGVIVLLKWKEGYEQIVKNADCFSSENEDGGVYYAPELWLEIKKNNLYVRYSHGRYGYWGYTFRLKDQDMEMIGYDGSENYGPLAQHITSINFLTKKKQQKDNINESAEEEEDLKYKETWSKVKIGNLLKLSEIKDFDGLDMSKY